jgi:hypothetical protein
LEKKDMTYDRVALKRGAKEAVTGVQPHPAGVTFVYLIVIGIINWLTITLSNYNAMFASLMDYSTGLITPEDYLERVAATAPNPLNYLILILLGIASSFVAVGFIR